MNRRGFLRGLLAAGVPAIVAGEELLELLAPRRTIVLPPPGGWPRTGRTIYYGDFSVVDIEALVRAELGKQIATNMDREMYALAHPQLIRALNQQVAEWST